MCFVFLLPESPFLSGSAFCSSYSKAEASFKVSEIKLLLLSLSLTWFSAMSQIVRMRNLLFVEICWVPCIPELLVYIFSCNHYAPLQGKPVSCEGEVRLE